MSRVTSCGAGSSCPRRSRCRSRRQDVVRVRRAQEPQRNKREWAALAKTPAARAELGSRREVRVAIIDLLVPLLGASGAQFHTFGPDALHDPMTVTQGIGHNTLEGITSTWARQLAELEGPMLGNLRDLGVVRLDDVATAERSPLPFLVVAERIAGQRAVKEPEGELTPRQREIVSLVRHGRSNAEIAERLEISANTVKNLLARAFKRHGVKSRTALIKVLGDAGARPHRARRAS